jgi:hypothetical protein
MENAPKFYPVNQFFNPTAPTLDIEKPTPLTITWPELLQMMASKHEMGINMCVMIQKPDRQESLLFCRTNSPDAAIPSEDSLIARNMASFPTIPKNLHERIADQNMEIIKEQPVPEMLQEVNTMTQEQAKNRGLKVTPIKRMVNGLICYVAPKPHWTQMPDAEMVLEFPESPSADELLDLYNIAKTRNSAVLMEFLKAKSQNFKK